MTATDHSDPITAFLVLGQQSSGTEQPDFTSTGDVVLWPERRFSRRLGLLIDVKFIEPITSGPARRKRYYQYTAIHDCTRLRVLRIYPLGPEDSDPILRLRRFAAALRRRTSPD